MRLLLLILFFHTVNYAIGQKNNNNAIDTSNYYNYFSRGNNLKGTGLGTNWLRLNEVVPIIIEEMEHAGHDRVFERKLFKIDTGHYIVVSAYSRSSNFGFLYIEGHDMFPSRDYRKDMTQRSRARVDYVSCEETPSGNPNFVRINHLPKNIFPLNENNYWYQYTGNPDDDKVLVTKEVAIKILRQDIRRYLQNVSEPSK